LFHRDVGPRQPDRPFAVELEEAQLDELLEVVPRGFLIELPQGEGRETLVGEAPVAPLLVVVDHPSVYEDAGGLPIPDVACYGREALVLEDLVECFDLAVRPGVRGADRPLEEAPVGDSFDERVGEEALRVVGEEQPSERERSLRPIVIKCFEGLELVAGRGEEAGGETGK
jgi:hypothetical protein